LISETREIGDFRVERVGDRARMTTEMRNEYCERVGEISGHTERDSGVDKGGMGACSPVAAGN